MFRCQVSSYAPCSSPTPRTRRAAAPLTGIDPRGRILTHDRLHLAGSVLRLLDTLRLTAAGSSMSPLEPLPDSSGTPFADAPLAVKIRYHLGLSVPEEFRDRLERQVASPFFPLFRLLQFWMAGVVAVVLLDLLLDGYHPLPTLIGFTIGGLIATTFFTNYQRRRFLESHEKRWRKARERDQSPDFRRAP